MHRRVRTIEWLAWVVALSASVLGNTAIRVIDAASNGEVLVAWRPLINEGSSALLVLVLLPAVLWACDRWPLHADTWRKRLPAYLLASVLWSLLHVLGMVLLRKFAYGLMGEVYDYGNWPRQLVYEYIKDGRTFALIVTIAHTYHWFVRRRQGEASLLDAPDEGPPVEPVDRPERFLIRKLGKEFLVAAADIEWLQASGNYVNLRVRGHDYPLRSTIGGIEARLDPACFARIHRSYIVNLDLIASIEPLDTGDARIHLKDGTVLPCSRSHREAIRGSACAIHPRA